MRAFRFEESGVKWLMKRERNTPPAYRHADHLGGHWTPVSKTIANKSIRLSFRRALQRAAETMNYDRSNRRRELMIAMHRDLFTVLVNVPSDYAWSIGELKNQVVEQLNIDY